MKKEQRVDLVNNSIMMQRCRRCKKKNRMVRDQSTHEERKANESLGVKAIPYKLLFNDAYSLERWQRMMKQIRMI